MTGGKSHPILIVGAGPTGLVLALWLKKRGIDFRIIDKSDKPGTTSRALAVQARTLEFYRQLSIDKKLIEQGVIADHVHMRRSGRVVASARFGAIGENVTHFPYLLFCPQDVHEEMLCEELRKLGVEVERNTELLSFNQNEKEVRVLLRTPKGEESLVVDYLCGCDGAHSVVRHQISEAFPGGTYTHRFFVADVLAEGAAAQDGVQISFSPKDFCIVMPVKKKASIRLTGIVPPESESKEKITFDDVSKSVQNNTGLNVKSVLWFSSYRVHHRMAERFQSGRIFLAGDAAHIHSPAGGQGMNTGIGDAVNLAWKLAEVIQKKATPQILESYSSERIPFAQWLLHNTDRAFRLIASRSWLGSLFRTFILPGLFANLTRYKIFLDFFFRTISQTRIRYRESFLSTGFAQLYAGDRLPWVQFQDKDNYESLQTLDWQIHVYGHVEEELSDFAKSNDLKIVQFDFNLEVESKGFLKDAIYVIRPDGYIGLAWPTQDIDPIKRYFAKLK